MTAITEFFFALKERLLADGCKAYRDTEIHWTYETPRLTDYVSHRDAMLSLALQPTSSGSSVVMVYGRLMGFGSPIDTYTEDHDLDVNEAMLRIQSYMRTLKQRADCFVESYNPQIQELEDLEVKLIALKAQREQKKQQLYGRTKIEADEILKGLAHAND